MKHEKYEPNMDVSQNSSDWDSGSSPHKFWSSSCDTVVRDKYFPVGQYEVAVKTIIQGTETGYYNFDYEVFENSSNVLELYY